MDFDQPVLLAELDLAAATRARLPSFTRVSRFPGVRRDIAVLVDAALPVAELLANVREAAGAYLTELTLFDVYQGKGIDPDRKSVALGLTFQDQSRTLDDQEVSGFVGQVIESLREKYNAELRG
jgi:phenylalanyl-tRNA synthetase beta chain